jgi:Uma2 family endonuclease
MTIEQKLMTADELARLPDDGMRYELVRGDLRTMAPPFYPHGKLARKVARSLDPFADAREIGETHTSEIGFRLTTGPDTVRVPDVAFISNERLQEAGDVRGYFPGSPDLVVEVISPNDLYTEVDQKVGEWLEHGARLVFVVNPRRKTVAVHRPGQPMHTLGIDDTLSGDDVVPGWTFPIRDLFDAG